MKAFRPVLACSLFAASGMASASNTLAQFPNAGINAIQVDPSGNIYVAGFQGTPGVPSTYDAFVAKLSPDGSQVLYSTTFAGSQSDSAAALAVDSTGAAYIWGQTQSPDFPVTTSAFQTTLMAPNMQGFIAKVDPLGNVVYATFIGGSSDISPSAGGLLVDSSGDVFASGFSVGGNFPTTPNAPFNDTDNAAYFVMELDPTGGILLSSMRGMGGLLASDSAGNIYIAGVQLSGPTQLPVSPGAFQASYQSNTCGGTTQTPVTCLYQYLAKVDSTLSVVYFATYLTGSYGASPSAISVDAEGNLWVAGTTNSPDYPVTGQFQPFYLASAPPGNSPGTIYPPPASGYVTELNPTGTGLLYSTYFSGSVTDTITFTAFTLGAIYISGQATSPDLPGFQGVPTQCLPESFSTVLTSDGLSLINTRTVPGSVLAYDSSTGALLSWDGHTLFSSDPMALQSQICVLNSVNLRHVSSIAPGELLSVFGQNFSSETTVSLNGLPAQLLYVSPEQINLQVPLALAGISQTTLALSTNISESRTLGVVPLNPVAFPLIFNSDGSQNTELEPAAAGTPVRIFLAGLGSTNSPRISFLRSSTGETVVNVAAQPGTVAGVWAVDLTFPEAHRGSVTFSLSVNGVPVRDELTIWMRSP